MNSEDLVKIKAKVCIDQISGFEVKRKVSMPFLISGLHTLRQLQ